MVSSIVVFDAHYVKNSRLKHEFYYKVEIVYTKELESADTYIEGYITSIPIDYNVKVATSDWAEQLIILGLEAARVSARELREEIIEMKKCMSKKFINKNPFNGNLLEHSLSQNILLKLERLRRNNDKAWLQK